LSKKDIDVKFVSKLSRKNLFRLTMPFSRQTPKGTAIAPVVDIFPHLMVGFHDCKRVREEMRLLKSLGFERVYFVTCNPGYPMFSNPALSLLPPNLPGVENFAARSLAALGHEPEKAYVEACHAEGMEAFAIYKPYEGGGGCTVPHGAQTVTNGFSLVDLGGDRIGFDSLLSAHPEWRVQRRPEPAWERQNQMPVNKLEISFQDFPGEVKFKLLVSRDNGAYFPWAEVPLVKETVTKLQVTDANGFVVAGGPFKLRFFCLDGFSIPADYPYLAIVIEAAKAPSTLPQSLIKISSGNEVLLSTATPFMRSPGDVDAGSLNADTHLWGTENQPVIPVDAEDAYARLGHWGFEHEWYGAGFWGPGWRESPVYGIARGKLSHLKGTPCEAYEGVRSFWLEEIERLLDAGFDGIDLRLQNHSGMVSDYTAYGFNQPIVEAFQLRNGRDPDPEGGDALEIMAVRGDFFMEFLEAAAVRIHGRGRRLQFHLRNCHEVPVLSHEFNELGFWAMPKVWLRDWPRVVELADEITLKDYYFRNYRPAWSEGIKSRAAKQGKRVWVHCYISQAQELREDFFHAINKDPGVGGILLYEVAHSLRNEVNHGLIEQYGPVGFHQPTIDLLNSILSKIGWPHP
jgi:hypothetical protein